MELCKVVPWGRCLAEYELMFNLNENDLNKKIISFGDGPASFNKEMTDRGKNVTSLDIIYRFSKDDIKNRINKVKDIIVSEVKLNKNDYLWSKIRDVEELESIRIDAMNNFLMDFEKGKQEERYVYHEFPNKTIYKDKEFDIGLSSHFLLLYSQLGLDFHIKTITEMLRICKEVRIFPILDLRNEKTEVFYETINYFKNKYLISIEKTDYEFQKGAYEMLVIKERKS